MKRCTLGVGALLLGALASRALAQDVIAVQIEADAVLRALVDELQRGNEGLRLDGLPRPYFIEYALVDANTVSISAVLGAVTSKSENRSRRLRADVRVGSYQLDNTNFRGGRRGGGGWWAASIPIEDDYNAIRQAIWWRTDRQYKSVVETLAKKKAFMESKTIEDKPDDFSREDPAVHFRPRAELSIDAGPLEDIALTLSRVFQTYPLVQSSGVTVTGAAGNKYLVNTEGTRIRIAKTRYSISANATVQADDGMNISSSISFPGRTPDDWPKLEEMAGRCREMAEQLIAVRSAPKLESYTGPVLFEAPAAATIFLRHFGRRFGGGQRPVGGRTAPDAFSKKIGKRILPRTLSVLDDPTRESIHGVPVLGHYKYDDQGIAARPVQLVKDGRLKAQVMSRNPSKEFGKSTGHGRGSRGISASIACLIVSDGQGMDADTLRAELIEAFQDEDLEFGIRIGSFGSLGGQGSGPSQFGMNPGFGSGGKAPLAMYRVFPDGREELVRGAEIGRFNIKAFKRLLAVGDKPYVLNLVSGGGTTVVTPAMLFEELDLAEIDRDFDKPPVLDSPLARLVHD